MKLRALNESPVCKIAGIIALEWLACVGALAVMVAAAMIWI